MMSAVLIPVFLLPLAMLWLLPLASDLLSLVVRMLRGPQSVSPYQAPTTTRLAFLVPAHNEALLIEAALCIYQAIRGQVLWMR